jgi:hypothetical protein
MDEELPKLFKEFYFHAAIWLPWQLKGIIPKLIEHCLVDLYQDCSYYSPLVKIGPAPGVFFLYVYCKKYFFQNYMDLSLDI